MDQETMKFMEELQEFVQKAQRFLQNSDGNFGQRGGYYGQRDNNSGQGGGYNQGSNYGQREQPWMHNPQSFPERNWGGQMPNIDPRYFM